MPKVDATVGELRVSPDKARTPRAILRLELRELLAELGLAEVQIRVFVEVLGYDDAACRNQLALVRVSLRGVDKVGVQDEADLGPVVLELGCDMSSG